MAGFSPKMPALEKTRTAKRSLHSEREERLAAGITDGQLRFPLVSRTLTI
ncbi:MAG: hypothetical protein ACRD6X_21330 [Pyrinomonadaceae bacterium]